MLILLIYRCAYYNKMQNTFVQFNHNMPLMMQIANYRLVVEVERTGYHNYHMNWNI